MKNLGPQGKVQIGKVYCCTIDFVITISLICSPETLSYE